MKELSVLMIGPGAPSASNAGLGIVVERIRKELSAKIRLISVEPEAAEETADLVSSVQFDEKTIVEDIVRVVVKEKIDPYSYYTSTELDKSESVESVVREIHTKYSESVYTASVEHDFDLIYVHDWVGMTAALALKKKFKKPLVIHVHSLDSDRIGVNHKSWVYDIEEEALAAADAIIAVSQYTADCIAKEYPGATKNITIVHPGMDPVLEIKNDSIDSTVLFLGRFSSQKAPLKFIEIAEKILKNKPETHFLMVGEGDLKNETIEKVAQKGLSGKIHFSEFIHHDKLSSVFAKATVLCMPSDSEPFGLVATEAAAYGIPVVISTQSGAKEVLKGAVSVDKNDINGFAESIIGYLVSDQLSKEATNLNRSSLKQLNWDRSIKAIITVLKSSLA